MKKLLALLVCIAFVFAVSGCGESTQTEQADTSTTTENTEGLESVIDGEQSWVDEYQDLEELVNDTFVVAFDRDNAPYSSVNEAGEVVGFDVDVAKAVCEQNGWTLGAKPIDWSKRDEVLASGEVNCLWGAVKYADAYFTDNNQEWSTYGEVYVDATVRTDSGINTMADLKGKHIEIEPNAKFAVEGKNATEWGQRVVKDAGRVDDVKDAQTAYEDLIAGRCDAIILCARSEENVDLKGLKDVEMATIYDIDVYSEDYEGDVFGSEETIYDWEHGAGFVTDNGYEAFVSDSINKLILNGEIDKIFNEWVKKEGKDGMLNTTFSLYTVDLSNTENEEGIYEFGDAENGIYEVIVEDADETEA